MNIDPVRSRALDWSDRPVMLESLVLFEVHPSAQGCALTSRGTPRQSGKRPLRTRLAGQDEGLGFPLGERPVLIGLAHHPGAYRQPGLAQQFRDLLRRPEPEI